MKIDKHKQIQSEWLLKHTLTYDQKKQLIEEKIKRVEQYRQALRLQQKIMKSVL
jgi:hypothetical protein